MQLNCDSLPVPVLMALDTAWELPEVSAPGSTGWPVASEIALATACKHRNRRTVWFERRERVAGRAANHHD